MWLLGLFDYLNIVVVRTYFNYLAYWLYTLYLKLYREFFY